MGEFGEKAHGGMDRAAGKIEEGLGKTFGNDYTEAKGDALEVEGDARDIDGDLQGDAKKAEREDREEAEDDL